jgi:predicted dehydrogenase
VYAEKSIANSLASAQSMVANAQKNNVALMEGYMFLYHTQHQQVKQLIADGVIGEIRHFSGAFGFPPLARDNFRYDAQIGGGALYDAAGYPLRAVHFMMGADYKVVASTLYFDPQTGTNTYGSAFLKNDSGIGAQIAFGFDHFYQCQYEVWGSKGKITATRAYTPTPDFKPVILLEQQGKSETIEAEPCNHFIGAMQEFYDIIVGNKPKQDHYTSILLQSQSQQLIQELGSKSV